MLRSQTIRQKQSQAVCKKNIEAVTKKAEIQISFQIDVQGQLRDLEAFAILNEEAHEYVEGKAGTHR